ncbi:oligosaccharide flippase family protein [Pluralibacter gergoviae]|uniref:oligosaccharide flippase family protein n=1 Tax=Pluralibacter gergoviae TaxID=61647 RepID=UPI000907E959|nr:oligosaccharide flippase family protein [Pluralibacter gergoviae]ELN2738042.1 oligosaccharide flippase family protein [Pluralibacter gergoviae]
MVARKETKQYNKYIGIIWFFLSSLFPAFSSFIIFTFASRQISPDELGSVSLALTLIIFLSSACGSGFGDALIQKKEIKSSHINTITTLLVIMALFLYICALSIVHMVHLSSFNTLFKNAFAVFGLKLLLDSTSVVPLSMLTKQMEFKKIGVRTMCCSVVATLVCIPILYLGGGVWAIICSQLISSSVSSIILWMNFKHVYNFEFNFDSFKDIGEFGIKTTLSKLVSALSLDNMVLGIAGSLSTLGIYSFSRRVFSVVSDVLVGTISNVSYPLYASKQNVLNELGSFYLKTTFISSLLCLPAFSGLFLISEDIIPLVFSEKWSVAIFCIKCCCILGFLSCIGTLQLSLIKALGRSDWILKYQIFQQISNGILALIFAKSGADNVMLAIVIKTYLVWPYTIYYVSKLLRLKLLSYIKSILKPLIITAVMVITFYYMKSELILLNVIYRILIEVIISVAICLIMTFLLSFKELRDTFQIIFKRKKQNVQWR